jgi:hypothetical protein
MGINRDYFHQEWIADLFDNIQFTGVFLTANMLCGTWQPVILNKR